MDAALRALRVALRRRSTCLLSGELLSAEGETYSDLGYVLWGFAAEDALGAPLSQMLQERLFAAAPASTT